MLSEARILYGILGFLWLEYLWKLYLYFRQLRVYNSAVQVPKELKGVLSSETYNKARLYGLDTCRFFMFISLFTIVYRTLVIWFEGILYFWICAGDIVKWLGFQQDEILQSVAFVYVVYTINTITNLLLNFYNHFVLEEKYGFNKQTVEFFIKDELKGYIVQQTIIMLLTWPVVYIIKTMGDYFLVYLWMFAVIAVFFVAAIYPHYIAPLYDKFVPLPEGELKTRVEQLATSVNFPLYKIFVVEGSKRSSHNNAYFYGFFKDKRIVLFDTLLKDYKSVTGDSDSSKGGEEKGCNTEEVLAVLGHELGHWKYDHMLKFIVIVQVYLLVLLYVFGLLFRYEVLYQAFGFRSEQPVIIGLMIIIQYGLSAFIAVLLFFTMGISRRFEFQADAFVKSLGKTEDLCHALIKLYKDNLAFPIDDWLYSMWYHSHPGLLERLKAMSKAD